MRVRFQKRKENVMRRIHQWFEQRPLTLQVAFVSAVVPWITALAIGYARLLWNMATCILDSRCNYW